MPLAEKLITGALGVIAIYLIVKNPQGDSAVVNSLSSGGSAFAKTLQGR